ncbi:chorismate synthase [Eubacteriaceae bacterium ES3]|nr:chorismate synthase [Eubacteriaceae bacterium ES3]
MSSIWGNKFKVSLFGESHGEGIGAVIDGVPSGIPIDLEAIQYELNRRAAKGKELATPRKEGDQIKILSGVFNGRTTGTPIAGVILNENTRSKDYEKTKDLMRPGHADYTASIRYGGYQDYRGGGHFSARVTAPLVFAGAVARQVLKEMAPSLKIGSRIISIKEIKDPIRPSISDYEEFESLIKNPLFPVFTQASEEPMLEQIRKAKAEEDSVGGIIEGFAVNMLPGLGDPFFESVESRLAALLFSIPAVKGVSFGLGFDITTKQGSQVNDAFSIKENRVQTETNYNGGINGGISNGMPIVFQVALKPTPSIGKEQKTINLATMENTMMKIEGRHDPCVVLRAFPVVEAALSICLVDLLI